MGGPRSGLGGTAGWGDRGPLDYNDIRQLRGEAQQRLTEARELRRAMAAEGQDVRQLDRAIEDMTKLTRDGPYASWDDLQKIQSSVVDRVKEIEFDMRKKAGEEESRKLFLAGSGEVPEGYRALVEKYYRDLADRPKE